MQSGACEGGAFDVKFSYQNNSMWNTCLSSLKIFVYAIWLPSTLKITKGSAVGGMVLDIKGLGFSSKYNYSCSFVYSEDINLIHSEVAEVQTISESLLEVVTPVWNYPARVVLIQLTMIDSTGTPFDIKSHDTRKGIFEIEEEIVAYQPSIVYSEEGASVMLQGAGLDFISQQVLPPFYKQTSDTNYLSVRKNVRYRLDAPGFSSWSCLVYNSSLMNCTIMSWKFEAQLVSFRVTKYWCDSSWNTPIEYNFEKDLLHSNLSLSIEFLPQIRRIEPTIGNAFGRTSITILGNGFENVESFCVFRDSGQAVIQNLTSIFVSSTEIDCSPTNEFADPAVKDVALSFELVSRGTSVQSVNELHFQASDINSAPTFSCQTLVISYSSLPHSYPFLYGISPNSSYAPNEQNQLLSFHIVDIPGFLLGSVSVQDSNLTFTTVDPEGGLIYLKIRIQDDGGNQNGGMNWTEKECKVYVLPKRSMLQNFEINQTMLTIDLVESEQDELYTYFGFITDIFYGVLQPYPDLSIQLISPEPDFQRAFRVSPKLEGGSLIFTTAAYANGDFILSVVIDQLPENSKNFTIAISSKNQAPEFVLVNDVFVFQQTLVNGTSFDQMFLSNISKGSRFDKYFEESQVLNFDWWPMSNEFPLENFTLYIPPDEPQTARIKFFIPPCVYGSFYVNVSLMDNGGSQFNGMSSVNFTVQVVVEAINTPPFFQLPALSLSVCEGSGSHEFPGFADAISKGVCAYEDLEQLISFLVWPVPGKEVGNLISEMSLNGSGVLSFNLSTSGFGRGEFYVMLVDDRMGGNNASIRRSFEIQVVSVHDPPTFMVSHSLVYDQPVEDSVLVFDNFFYNISNDVFGAPSPCLNQTFLFEFDPELPLAMYGDELLSRSSLGDCLRDLQVYGNGSLMLSASPVCFGEAAMKVNYVERTCFSCTNTSSVFNVTVRWVNKKPGFDVRDQTIDECVVCGELELEGAAVNITAGSVYEDRVQRVSFTVSLLEGESTLMSDDFESVSLDANGTLRVKLKSSRRGTANFSVSLRDDGGIERGGVNVSDVKLLQLVVLPVNNRPSFSLLPSLPVLEGSGCSNFTQVAFNISAGAGNEIDQLISFTVISIDPPSFLADQPCSCSSCPPFSIDPATGLARFQVLEHQVGNFTVEVQLVDSGGTERGGQNVSAPETIELVILPVNDQPTFAVENFDVYEQQELVHVSRRDVAINISVGISPDEVDQKFSFIVNLLSSTQDPLISDVSMLPNGTLLFLQYPRANGLATLSVIMEDNGGTANGGSNTSTLMYLNITVVPVNSQPTFELVNVSLWEGTEFSMIADVARNISAGAADEGQQLLTFQVEVMWSESVSFPDLPPAFLLHPNGTLASSLPPYRNGEVQLSVVLSDDGGTANGGVNRSVEHRLGVRIEPVNNAPYFEVANESWYEDSTEVHYLAFNISRGSPYGDEDWQNVTFHISFVEGAELFERLAVESDGRADYLLTANMFGVAMIELVLVDDGGTARNGQNTSLPRLVTITVLPVNDPPTFSLYPLNVLDYNFSSCTRGLPTIVMDMNAYVSPHPLVLEGFVQNISRGGWHEADQTLSFFLEPEASDLDLLAEPLRVWSNGTIVIEQRKDASGCLTFSLRAVDSGMGSNTSAAARFNLLMVQSEGKVKFQRSPSAPYDEASLLQSISQSLHYPAWLLSLTTGSGLASGTVTLRSDLPDYLFFEFLTSSPISISGIQLLYSELVVQQIDSEQELYHAVLLHDTVGALEDSSLQTFHLLTNITLRGNLRKLIPGLLQTAEYTVQSSESCLQDCFEVEPHVEVPPCSFNQTCDAFLSFRPSANSYCVCRLLVSLVGSSYSHNVTVVVDPLNDAPTFEFQQDVVTVYETHQPAGELIVIEGLAKNISAGPKEDQDQKLTFVLTPLDVVGPLCYGGQLMDCDCWPCPTNVSATAQLPPSWLILQEPELDAVSGNLSFILAPDAIGFVLYRVDLLDSGPTGVNQSNVSISLNLTINVTRSNQPPSFQLTLAEVTMLESCQSAISAGDCEGLQFTLQGFAVNISQGPANEQRQTVSFLLVLQSYQVPFQQGQNWVNASSSPAAADGWGQLLSEAINVDSNGTLRASLLPQHHGKLVYDISLLDSGLSGGRESNRSPSSRFVFHVISVNDAPSFSLDPLFSALDWDSLCSNSSSSHLQLMFCVDISSQERSLEPQCHELDHFVNDVTGNLSLYSSSYNVSSASCSSKDLAGAVLNGTCEGGDFRNVSLLTSISFLVRVPTKRAAIQQVQERVQQVQERVQHVITSVFASSAVNSSLKVSFEDNVTQCSQSVNKSNAAIFRSSFQLHFLPSSPLKAHPCLFACMPHDQPVLLDLECSRFCLESTVTTHLLAELKFDVFVIDFLTRFDSDRPVSVSINVSAGPGDWLPSGSSVYFQYPRVHCSGLTLMIHNLVDNVTAGGWGEENQSLWFSLERFAGPDMGRPSIRFPFGETNKHTVFIFELNDLAYGTASYNVTLHDSGSEMYGGRNRETSKTPLQVSRLVGNFRPTFALVADQLEVMQDSSCVENPIDGRCYARCQYSHSLCSSGPRAGARCGANSDCPGACEEGVYYNGSNTCVTGCMCSVFGDVACEDIGVCSCSTPNNGALCLADGECTGGGKCRGRGECRLEGDNRSCTTAADCLSGGTCENEFLSELLHVKLGVAVNISAGSLLEQSCDQQLRAHPDQFECRTQQVSFLLVPDNETDASSLFAQLPTMDSNGTLSFRLSPNKHGVVQFTVLLQDDSMAQGTNISLPRPLTILVARRAAFDVQDVVLFEGSSQSAAQVASNIRTQHLLTTNGTLTYSYSFSLQMSHPQLFLSSPPPSVDTNGVLHFALRPFEYGTSTIRITLADLSYPAISSFTVSHDINFTVSHVNSPPTFSLLFDRLVLPPGLLTLQEFELATNISAGPNEDCSVSSKFCEVQALSFVVTEVSNPVLFRRLPSVDARSGKLVFQLRSDQSGSSTMNLTLVDDGMLNDIVSYCNQTLNVSAEQLAACEVTNGKYAGVNKTTKSLVIILETPQPFSVARVMYNIFEPSANLSSISCPSLLEYSQGYFNISLQDTKRIISSIGSSLVPSSPCELVPGVRASSYSSSKNESILLMSYLGERQISSYATLLRQGTFLDSSFSAFVARESSSVPLLATNGSNTSSLTSNQTASNETNMSFVLNPSDFIFYQRAQDKVLSTRGLEYSMELVFSSDEMYAYSPEAVSDTLSVWSVSTTPGMELSFLTRRAHDEERVRFKSTDVERVFDYTPDQVYTPDLCVLQSFPQLQGQSDDPSLFGVGNGCVERSFLSRSLASSLPIDYAADAELIGYWDFTEQSMRGNQSVSSYREGEICQQGSCTFTLSDGMSLACEADVGCTFRRKSYVLPTCLEPSLDLEIFPSTFQNLASSSKLSSLLLMGPTCRVYPDNLEWLAGSENYGLLNVIANNGEVEAVQFDGVLNSGLFLTNDIRSVTSTNYVDSALPTHAFSVEAWVTVDKPVAPSGSQSLGTIFAAASGDRNNEAGSCNKGWMLSYEVLATNQISFYLDVATEKLGAVNGLFRRVAVNLLSSFFSPTECKCIYGTWFHIVAIYDGFNLKLFVTAKDLGTRNSTAAACDVPPCGAIYYPYYHPQDPTVCYASGPVPVTIGNYTNTFKPIPFQSYNHVGMIKMLTLWKGALSTSQVSLRFNRFLKLADSPSQPSRYWGKVPGISPSMDFVDAEVAGQETSPMISLKGVFESTLRYKCRFTTTVPVEGPGGSFQTRYAETMGYAISTGSKLGFVFGEPYGNSYTLKCPTPTWSYGNKETILSVWEESNVLTSLTWRPLWQKVCLTTFCGYKKFYLRYSQASATNLPGWSFALRSLTSPPLPNAVPCAFNDTAGSVPINAFLAHSAGGSITSFFFIAASSVWAFSEAFQVPQGDGPVDTVIIEDGGKGFVDGWLTMKSNDLLFPDFSAQFSVDASNAISQVTVRESGPRLRNNLVKLLVTYGEGCATSSSVAECRSVRQQGTVTYLERRVNATMYNCTANGKVYTAGKGFGFVASYITNGTEIVSTSFMSVSDHGTNVPDQVELFVSDHGCRCVQNGNQTDANGYPNVTGCLIAHVAGGEKLTTMTKKGMKRMSRVVPKLWGVKGLQDCLQVSGCLPDPLGDAYGGSSAIQALTDLSSGTRILILGNFPLGERQSDYLTIWNVFDLLQPPAPVQKVQTPGTMGISLLSVPPFSAPRAAAVANFLGQSSIYRWLGPSPVLFYEMADPGLNFPPHGLVRSLTDGLPDQIVGNFSASGPLTSLNFFPDRPLFPGTTLSFVYGDDCADEGAGCRKKNVVGSVGIISLTKPQLIANCTAQDVLTGGGGFKAYILNASGVLEIRFRAASDRGTNITGCNGKTSFNECLDFSFVSPASVSLFPQDERPLSISLVDILDAGVGYIPGTLRATSLADIGQGFSADFDTTDGRLSEVKVQSAGQNYLPGSSLEIFYGPGCALKDDACNETAMTGTVTLVEQDWEGSGTLTCQRDGFVTATHPTGEGFRAELFVDGTGRVSFWFRLASSHGSNYSLSPSAPLPLLSPHSNCTCRSNIDQLLLNITHCVRLVVATGARVVGRKQEAMRSLYCHGADHSACPGLTETVDTTIAMTTSRLWPVDTLRPYQLDTKGAVAVDSITLQNFSLVAFASYYDRDMSTYAVPSRLFAVRDKAGDRLLDAEVFEYQQFPTVAATNVLFVRQTCILLMFTQYFEDTLVYQLTNLDLSMRSRFLLLQSLHTRSATSLSSFEATGTFFLLVTQDEALYNSSMFRWNGSSLNGVQTLQTLNKDSSSGQFLPSSYVNDASTWTTNGTRWVLLGAHRNLTQNSSVWSRKPVFSNLYRMQTEFRVNMLHPVDMEMSNDGRFIYVASYSSQTLMCFRRNPSDGNLFADAACSYGPHRSDYVPLGALTSLALTKDSSKLLATSASEHALYVFCIDTLNGELTLHQIVSMRCYDLMSSIDIVDSAITDSFLQTVRDQMVLDGRLVDALRGAAMVAVSGQTAVVAAAIDHALSVFFLPLGCSPIQYVDRIREGERSLSGFQQPMSNSSNTLPWSRDASPRMFDLHDSSMNFTRMTREFRVNGELMLAVVVGSDSSDIMQPGSVEIYKWDIQVEQFVFLQDLTHLSHPTDVVFFTVPTRGQQVDSSLLAVADLRPDLRSAYDAAGGINVYLWDVQEQMFVFFQVVDTKLLPQSSLYDGNNFKVVHTCPTCEPAAAISSQEYPPCYASSDSRPWAWMYDFEVLPNQSFTCNSTVLNMRLSTFTIDGIPFLAAAFLRPQHLPVGSEWLSAVFRWNNDGRRSLESGKTVDMLGFDFFQPIATSSASAVLHLNVSAPSGTLRHLIVYGNSYQDDNQRTDGLSSVWEWFQQDWNPFLREKAGLFRLVHRLPVTGVTDITSCTVQGPTGSLLLVGFASVQSASSAQSSPLYRWEQDQLVEFQALPEASSSLVCFHQRGDVYLALAHVPPAYSEDEGSSFVHVLQWDKATSKFSALMSITDDQYRGLFGSDVPSSERRIHEAHLKVPAGLLLSATIVQPSPALSLMCLSSLTTGLVMYEFDFSTLKGLQGVSVVNIDNQGNVFAVSPTARTLVHVKVQDVLDSSSRVVSNLTWVQTWSEQPLQLSRLNASVSEGIVGLAGAVRMELSDTQCYEEIVTDQLQMETWRIVLNSTNGTNVTNATSFNGTVDSNSTSNSSSSQLNSTSNSSLPCNETLENCSSPTARRLLQSTVMDLVNYTKERLVTTCFRSLLVRSRPPRFNLPCGTIPPLSVVHELVPPICRSSSFSASFLGDQNAIATSPPAIDKDGKLSFNVKSSWGGEQTLAISSDSSNITQTAQLTLLSANFKPMFQLMDVVVNEDAGLKVVDFASGVRWMQSPKVAQWQLMQNITCSIVGVTRPATDVFAQLPTFITLKRPDGRYYGVTSFQWSPNVYGECSVQIQLVIDDDNIPAEFRESHPASFILRSLPVNDPPSYILQQSSFSILQGQPFDQHVLSCLSWYPDDIPQACSVPNMCLGSLNTCFNKVLSSGLTHPSSNSLGPGGYQAGPFCNLTKEKEGFTCWYRMEMANVTRCRTEMMGVGNTTVAVEVCEEDRGVVKSFYYDNGFLHVDFDPGSFGSFVLTFNIVDNGGRARGGLDTATFSFRVQIGQVVAKPEVVVQPPAITTPVVIEQNVSVPPVVLPPLADLAESYLIVDEVAAALVHNYTGFFQFADGGLDQQTANVLTVVVTSVTRKELFLSDSSPTSSSCTGCPVIALQGLSGSLTFVLAPYQYGVSSVTFLLRSQNRFDASKSAEASHSLDIIVLPVNNPPSAAVSPLVAVLSDRQDLVVDEVFTNISVGPANELWQNLTFVIANLHYTPLLLGSLPHITPEGSLHLNLSQNHQGTLNMSIVLADSGGTQRGGRNESAAVDMRLKVFGMPLVTSIFPCVGRSSQGWTMTIIGNNFLDSLPADAAPYVNFEDRQALVYVGRELCLDLRIASSSMITCIAPNGSMPGRMPVTVSLPSFSSSNPLGVVIYRGEGRSFTYSEGVVHADLMFGGSFLEASANHTMTLLALGPGLSPPAASCNSSHTFCPAAEREVSASNLLGQRGVVRALEFFQGKVMYGGTFRSESRQTSYLVMWDGVRHFPVGGGLNGPVYSLSKYKNGIAAGGAFSRIFRQQTSVSDGLQSGGLGFWNGTSWSLIGGRAVNGVVFCSVTVGDNLYVGGRFNSIGDTTMQNIAVFDGLGWSAIGGGLQAAEVNDMSYSADVGLVVVGTIYRSGDTILSNVVRWDFTAGKWLSLGEFDQTVRAGKCKGVVTDGNNIYIGGDFQRAGNLKILSMAKTVIQGGVFMGWKELAAAVEGNVHSMLYSGGFLYVGGDMKSVTDGEGKKSVQGLMRRRMDMRELVDTVWQPLRGAESFMPATISSISRVE
ncbi:hypothetical protein GUITHDRAFT_104319 [Guillardia theta CCMP2712]|uniref:Cadherin domain-containing protein n=1 Tax=Guillardia theta (strain CCMP2712) TaxID=905079 RepID=L1JPD3_GUITC|nr:hypothetical protein GUITHDRAFT_104319 [Guillardia theta CCMP2712]EKX49923.1 hypothetical protein GUITHDRAFT_104319 [Guillardia theta CCMP2712]|eukprot:XP_005836903.1 hypothetical protein GUITHDRAFT_104319 [Guillardia theta CCMP2712]